MNITFNSGLAAIRATKEKIESIGSPELPDITIGEHEAVADIVQLAADIVNMFTLARRDTAIVLDREIIMEEVELMVMKGENDDE